MRTAKIHSVAAGELPTLPAPSSNLASLYKLAPLALWRQLKEEHVSFWLACAYLLFEYVRPQTIYPAINFLPWSAVFAVGALLTSFADKRARPPGSSISKLIVLYAIVVLLSSVAAYDPALSFKNLDAYFNWFIIYFAIVRTVRTKERFFIFFVLYMLCNFKMSQHGFLRWASRGFTFDIDGVGGSPGWFQNSGEFGIQLCIFTPLIIAFIVSVRPFCSRLMMLLMYAAPFTAIASTVASSSRGALIGLVAAGVWSLKTSKYFVRGLVATALIGVAVYYAIPPESKARFENSGSDRTSLHRLDRWHKGWEVMKEYPLLGVGYKNWEEYYAARLNYGVPGTPLVHNMFIEAGAELGFLGLGTLTLLILNMFLTDRRTRVLAKNQSDQFAVNIAHGLDAATIGLIVSASFVTVLYYPYVWIHAAFVASLRNSVTSHEISK